MYIAPKNNRYLERIIRLVAGVFSLTGAVLAYFVSIYWLILPAFVGLNLIIFSLTGFCTMANILIKLGAKSRLK